MYGAADLGDRAVSFVPVFYPGVVAAQDASPITLQPGDERDGVDFTLQVVPAATVDGRVVSEDGRGVPGARVTIAAEGVLGTMQRSTAAGAEGRFRFRDVGPGEYVLAARAGDTRESLRRSAGTSWATTAVVVDGVDVSDVELVLRPGFRIRGMVVFVGGAAEPRPDPTGVRITILARARPQSRRFSATDLVAPATVSAGGWFEVSDLPAGDYWMSAAVPGSQPGSGWRLASIVVNREEVLDRPFRLDPGSAREVEAVVTFEATHTSVSGTLRVGERRVAGDYFVVVFPTDRSRWWPLSRRVQVARPDTAGTFTFVDLAPGEYWLAAVSDLLPNEWEDPQFLEALIPAAVRVTLAEGERRRLDLVAQDARR